MVMEHMVWGSGSIFDISDGVCGCRRYMMVITYPWYVCRVLDTSRKAALLLLHVTFALIAYRGLACKRYLPVPLTLSTEPDLT